jgi:hypothetical protein
MKNRSIPELECLETRQVPDRSGMAALDAFPLASAPLVDVAAPVLSQDASAGIRAGGQSFADSPPPKSLSRDQESPTDQDTAPAVAGVPADVEPLEKSYSLPGGDSPKGGQAPSPIRGNGSKNRSTETPAPSRFDFPLCTNRHDEGAAALRQLGTPLARRENGSSQSTLGTQVAHEPLKIAEKARTASVGKLLHVRDGGPWLKAPGSRFDEDSAPAPGPTRPFLSAKAEVGTGELCPRGLGTANGLDLGEVDKVFATLWETPREDKPPSPLMRSTGNKEPGTGYEAIYLAPVWLSVLVPATGQPLDPVARGYQYLCNYSHIAIHAAERRVGPLRDHEDIVQQVCVEWLERAGPPDQAFPKLLERRPAEMRLLRETVNRVIARAVYHQKKQDVTVNFTDAPAPEAVAERAWVEFKSDCERGVGHLSRQEWQVLELRRQGKTFAEIGSDTRMSKQQACKIYHAVSARLQEIYGSRDG